MARVGVGRWSIAGVCLLGACAQELQPSAVVNERELAQTLSRRIWKEASGPMPAFAAPALATLHDKVTLVGSVNELTRTGKRETWEWDGSEWRERALQIAPSDSRLTTGLVRHGENLIMLSELSNFWGPLSETWQWDGESWRQQSSSYSPRLSSQPSLASLGDTVLYFGAPSAGAYPETWRWNAGWTQVYEAGGPERCGSPMAALGNKALLFCPARELGEQQGHTWEWSGTQWSEKQTTTRPSSRYAHALASFGDRIVMYGGYAESGNWQETWEWDGSDWHERSVIPSPPARDGYQLTQRGDLLVLYGGGDGDTWTWDGASWRVAARSSTPTQRMDYAIGTLAERAIVFGGCCQGRSAGAPEYWDDTWAWDGQRWRELSSSQKPPPRAAAKLAAIGGKLVLFGGVGATGVLDDTWELDGDEWRELSPVARPPARQRHAMASYAGKVYVFGGASTASPRDSALLGDMWEWDGSQWRQVFSEAGSGAVPEPSDHCAMSKLGDELVLLTATSRLHIWDGRTWSLREYDPARAPYIVPESAVELPVDADGPRLLIAGRGYGPYTSSEWDGTSWSGSLGLSVVMGPIALQGAALVSLAGTPLHTWLYASR